MYRKLSLSLLVAASAVRAEHPPAGEIAITFDDGPRGNGPFFSGSERAGVLIDALDAAGVSGAMFFVTTKNLDARGKEGAQRLRRYVDAGHLLANHSHEHNWLSRTEADDYLADIDRAAAILARFEGTAPFFRFPYLNEGSTVAQRDSVRRGLADRGLKNGYVTVDTYDWYLASLTKEAIAAGHDVDIDQLRKTYVDYLVGGIDFYDDMARESLGRSPRHVLLLHENDLAALFIGDLVASLRERGWKIISALEAYDDPIASIAPDTLFLGQGRVAAIAHQAGRARKDLVHETEDEDYLRAEFIRRGLLPAP